MVHCIECGTGYTSSDLCRHCRKIDPMEILPNDIISHSTILQRPKKRHFELQTLSTWFTSTSEAIRVHTIYKASWFSKVPKDCRCSYGYKHYPLKCRANQDTVQELSVVLDRVDTFSESQTEPSMRMLPTVQRKTPAFLTLNLMKADLDQSGKAHDLICKMLLELCLLVPLSAPSQEIMLRPLSGTIVVLRDSLKLLGPSPRVLRPLYSYTGVKLELASRASLTRTTPVPTGGPVLLMETPTPTGLRRSAAKRLFSTISTVRYNAYQNKRFHTNRF